MRAMFVLAVILSFATPQVSRTAIELSRDASASISLAAPSAASQLVRAVAAKTDKTFGPALTVPVDAQPLYPPSYTADGHSIGAPDLPNVDLGESPLAPRPPPLC